MPNNRNLTQDNKPGGHHWDINTMTLTGTHTKVKNWVKVAFTGRECSVNWVQGSRVDKGNFYNNHHVVKLLWVWDVKSEIFRGWRDVSVVKSIDCSSRGPWIPSTNRAVHSQYLTIVSGDQYPSLTSIPTKLGCGVHTCACHYRGPRCSLHRCPV